MRGACCMVLVGVLLSADAGAMFARCEQDEVPVERLIKNIKAYIASHPDDLSGPYTLARMNYYAFSARSTELYPGSSCAKEPAGDEAHLPSMTWGWKRGGASAGHRASSDELRHFLEEAIHQLHVVLSKQPDNPLYWNTLASVLEEGASFAPNIADTAGMPPGEPPAALAPADMEAIRTAVAKSVSESGDLTLVPVTPKDPDGCATGELVWRRIKDKTDPVLGQLLERCWIAHAFSAYTKAFDLAYATESKLQYRGLLDERISIEAGNALIRLIKARGTLTPADTARIEEIGRKVDLISQQQGPVTPIVMALDAAHPLADLVTESSVRFDLDGTGGHTQWSWVKPTTGILVWDPRRTGRITSGHQLLGEVTFQMFWRSGYAALDALDDNRDGVLTGEELDGLALWFDRNSDGVSDPGEVVPLQRLGVVELDVAATGHEGDAPMNGRGVRLRDGRVLPTYDWLAHPAVSPRRRPGLLPPGRSPGVVLDGRPASPTHG